MINETEKSEPANPAEEAGATPEETASDEAEFKITVRKLELPVRPRGVLAE